MIDMKIQSTLAAARFNWSGEKTAIEVMDRLLQPDGPMVLYGFARAVLPVCDEVMNKLWPDNDVVVRYEEIVLKETDDQPVCASCNQAPRVFKVIRETCKIGVGYQRETKINGLLQSLIYLRAALTAVVDGLCYTDRLFLYREVIRCFRLAFESPATYEAGFRHAQSEFKSAERRKRINLIRTKLLPKGLSRTEMVFRIMSGDCGRPVGKSMAYKDLREAKAQSDLDRRSRKPE